MDTEANEPTRYRGDMNPNLAFPTGLVIVTVSVIGVVGYEAARPVFRGI